MPELNDCYVLAPERSASLAVRFLDRFVPRREPAFAPEDPSEVLGLPRSVSIDQVLEHLEVAVSRGYSMYFHNRDECDPLHAAVMFNEDGSLFLMLSVAARGGDAEADRFRRELQKFAGARFA
jgi:hypothetical protein